MVGAGHDVGKARRRAGAERPQESWVTGDQAQLSAQGARRARGALSAEPSRFIARRPVADDAPTNWDAPWEDGEETPTSLPRLEEEVYKDHSRTVLSYNRSPDIPFDRAVNPYRGCAHGCIYCYARPSHAYLDLSPGLDFETKIFVKPQVVGQLEAALNSPSYQVAPLVLGSNTDCYQPLERRFKLTRGLLELLWRRRHPVVVITKSASVLRDRDILAALAQLGLVRVFISITTNDALLAARMEPRASSPAQRFATLSGLNAAGIPCGVMIAPVIPGLTDRELETLLGLAKAAGARMARMSLLRLPGEVRELFEQWLEAHVPQSKDRVMSLLRSCYGGRVNAPFMVRGRGRGVFADLLQQRFQLAFRRLAFSGWDKPLACDLFRAADAGGQLDLFGDPPGGIAAREVLPAQQSGPPGETAAHGHQE